MVELLPHARCFDCAQHDVLYYGPIQFYLNRHGALFLMAKVPLLALLSLLAAAPAAHAQNAPRLPSRARPVRKARLDRAVPETSALLYTDGALWTVNDGGNAPVLFRLDSATGNVLQQVRLRNVANVDWEALTADANYLYVGDFGNNAGKRRNLRVLRVAKTTLGPAADTVAADEIAFHYPEQTDFSTAIYRHNFDCEAFFYFRDSLHFFTKNWADRRTRYYTVPAQPGSHAAHFKETFDVKGLVTAAALNPAGTAAALLGYDARNGATFLWLLSDFADTRFFAGQARRLRLPNALRIGQAEGLCFVGPHRVFVSNERLARYFALVPQRLYALNLRRWLGLSAASGPTQTGR